MKKAVFGMLAVLACFGFTGCTDEINNAVKDEKLSHEVSKEYTDSIGVHYIEGTVKNENDKEYSYLQIEFVCYDKDSNNIGTALANTNNLGSNESWKFKAMLMSTNGEADHCDFKEITGY